MMLIAVAVVCGAAAIGAIAYAMFQPELVRIAPERRRSSQASAAARSSLITDRLSEAVDAAVRRGAWAPFSSVELELARVRATVGSVVVTIGGIAFVVFAVVTVLAGSVLAGLIASAFVPFGAKAWIGHRGAELRKAFDQQLEATLQMLASALRAGHSLPRAMESVARESPSPTAEEFGRIVNEGRIGRDLVESMVITARRMDCQDFRWVAEAVAVQRETGGNLNEVLDRVGSTIRERGALKREVQSLSAEGRLSAKIMMALPLVVTAITGIMNPANLVAMFTQTTGLLALGVAVLLFVVGTIWMKVVVGVKV